MSEKCARRRDARAGRYTAPPARCGGTSTLTVPAMCTSGVRVVLLPDGSARRAREQQADDGVDDRESPDLAAVRRRRRPRGASDADWCPITCCGLDVRVRCEGFYFCVTQEIGVRHPILGYLEFRVKRQGEEDGKKGSSADGDARAWHARPADEGEEERAIPQPGLSQH